MTHDEVKEEIESMGYTQMSSMGSTRNYINNESGLHLSVTFGDEVTAELSTFHMLVECKLGPFAFPHKFFNRFEKQVRQCHPYLRDG